MDAKKRLTSSDLNEFLESLGIRKEAPVGRSSASGEGADETQLDELLKKGDPVLPCAGRVAEDAATLTRLFDEAGESACFGLTPDGHLTSHHPIVFDPEKAAEQVIALVEAEMASEDKEEALAATWLGLAYHDHDYPADFGGLLREVKDGRPRCCYVDVKGTRATSPGSQRTKLERRAQERKFGCLALTVTTAANNGFARYPGRGKPALLVTLLHNPVVPGKNHSGYAVGWFFGIASNYQAKAAAWGWGGDLGVKLPQELQQDLESRTVLLGGQETNLLELLRQYRDYSQFRDEQGVWDRERLRFTLIAKSLAARHLLMQEDSEVHAEQTVDDLQPKGVEMPLDPTDFHPGESFAIYFGRQADAQKRRADEVTKQRDEEKRRADEEGRRADEEKRRADEEKRRADEEKRRADELTTEFGRQADAQKRQADELARRADEQKRRADEEGRRADELTKESEDEKERLVARLRRRGLSDQDIAEDFGCSVEELQQRFPPPR